jgi:hypothetical protein
MRRPTVRPAFTVTKIRKTAVVPCATPSRANANISVSASCRSCEPSKIHTGMPGDVLLICGERHCASDEHAKGWSSSGDPKRQLATREVASRPAVS